jgi:hypothetical protein
VAEGISISLYPSRLEASPGQSVSIVATVTNTGTVFEGYVVGVEGIDPKWCTIRQTRFEINQGEDQRQQVPIDIQLPSISEAKAGTYHIVVKAVTGPKEHPVEATADLILVVSPVLQFDLDLRQRNSKGGKGRHQVCIKNTGNATTTYTLEGHDTDDKCRFGFDDKSVTLEPGENREVPLVIEAKKRPFTGSSQTYNFEITVTPHASESGDSKKVPGSFECTPWVPRWALAGGGLGLAAIVAIAVIFASGVFSGAADITATPTPTNIPLVSADTTSPTPNITINASSPTPKPMIAVSAHEFYFTATEGCSKPLNQTLEVWNSGTGTLNWRASSNKDWLTLISPLGSLLQHTILSGTSTSESDSITIALHVDITDITAGSEDATITITAIGVSNTPQTVTVHLNISPCPSDPQPWDVKWYKYDGSKLANYIDSSAFSPTFDTNWGTGNVFSGYSNNVGFRASAELNMQNSGWVTFTVGSDDGCRLYVDGYLLINEWHDGSYLKQIYTRDRFLSSGRHDLILEYYENGDVAHVSFNYSTSVGLTWPAPCP